MGERGHNLWFCFSVLTVMDNSDIYKDTEALYLSTLCIKLESQGVI